MYIGPFAPKVFGQRYSWDEHGMKVDPQGGWVNADDFSELSKTGEKVIALYQPLLDAIPPCPAHGANCIVHAIEWIKDAKDTAIVAGAIRQLAEGNDAGCNYD